VEQNAQQLDDQMQDDRQLYDQPRRALPLDAQLQR